MGFSTRTCLPWRAAIGDVHGVILMRSRDVDDFNRLVSAKIIDAGVSTRAEVAAKRCVASLRGSAAATKLRSEDRLPAWAASA